MGSRKYSTPIDLWSTGCIFAEMVTGRPMFPGQSASDELVKIYRLMGTPTEQQWPGIVELPDYKPPVTVYPAQPLPVIVPGLTDVGYDLLAVSFA